MHTPQDPPSPAPSMIMPLKDGASILRSARQLAVESDPERSNKLLKHRNVALISDEEDPSQNAFCHAALKLGARVSHIRPSLTDTSSPEDVQQTARLLGRLYSAFEWPHISAQLLEQLKKEAGVPVYPGISLRSHSLWPWAAQLDIDATPEEKWRYVIQAVLLRDLS